MEDWNYLWVLFAMAPVTILLGWGLNLLVSRKGLILPLIMTIAGLVGSGLGLWLSARLDPLAFTHAWAIGGIFFWVGWRNQLWWSTGFKRHIKEQQKGYLLLYLRIQSFFYRLLFLILLGGAYIFFLYLAFEFPWGLEFRFMEYDYAVYIFPLVLTLITGLIITQLYGRSSMIIVDGDTKIAKLLHLKSPEWIVSFEECAAMDLVYHPKRPNEMLLVIRTVYGNDLIVDEGRDRKHLIAIAAWFKENLGLNLGERADASISVGR